VGAGEDEYLFTIFLEDLQGLCIKPQGNDEEHITELRTFLKFEKSERQRVTHPRGGRGMHRWWRKHTLFQQETVPKNVSEERESPGREAQRHRRAYRQGGGTDDAMRGRRCEIARKNVELCYKKGTSDLEVLRGHPTATEGLR